MVYYTLYLG